VSSPASSPVPSLVPSRRSLLLGAGGVATVLVAGCDATADDRPPVPETDPTSDMLRDLLGRTTVLIALGQATAAAHPRLATALEGLRLTHDDHARVLRTATGEEPTGSPLPSPSDPTAPPAPSVPRRPDRALGRLQQAESAHARLVLDRARTADEGQVARLLASMGAGLTQQLTLLPTEPPR